MITDNHVQQSIVANLSQRPKPVEVGPFVIGVDPTTDSRFINYATPVPGAQITGHDVAALVAAFRSHGLVPRLEYVTSCAPDLEAALLNAGFTIEARHDYLVCTPATLVAVSTPDSVEIVEPTTDGERAALVAVQNGVFGGEPVATPEDVARTRRSQDRGAVFMLARTTGGDAAGGGGSSPPSAGLVEVAGIAVREQYRRRGIAGALTAAITARAFVTGAEQGAWLEASGQDSWRVYERVGYVPNGQRLYIALDAM